MILYVNEVGFNVGHSATYLYESDQGRIMICHCHQLFHHSPTRRLPIAEDTTQEAKVAHTVLTERANGTK